MSVLDGLDKLEGKPKVYHRSSAKTYVTPDYIFEPLNKRFHFRLDAAATTMNAKCRKYYTKANDALRRPWEPGPVWCNPPYGRNLYEWVMKAYNECYDRKVVVVMLLPFRPDTRWYRSYVNGFAFERPIQGRVVFEGMEHGAPFPSFLAIYHPWLRPRQSEVWLFPK
jgi:site-specific DNA-methyltransferase (adenine-specific)